MVELAAISGALQNRLGAAGRSPGKVRDAQLRLSDGCATMENYHIQTVVGEGSFGKVYKGRRRYSGQIVALKFIPKGGRSEKDNAALRQEIEILRSLRHENIVLMLDYFETDSEMCVVTEFAQGELFEVLEDDKSLPEAEIRQIAR